MLLLSGCGTYQQTSRSLPLNQLRALHPHYAPIKYGQIEYYQFGKGSPLLLLPGYATDVSSWNRDFLATLAQHHRIIALNNRNVGRSYIQSNRYETQDLAKDTYQLIQALHLKKPAVLGISMGGMIAQQLAVLYPHQISALILINTAIAGDHSIHPSPTIQQKMLNMPTNKLGRYVTAIQLFFPPAWRMQMAYTLAADRFKPANYKEVDPVRIMPQQQHLLLNWVNDNATARKLKQLRMPVLILNGGADMVLPSANSTILARTIPHAKLIRFKEGGHAMIYQYPTQIADLINHFIAAASSRNKTKHLRH